MRLAVDRTAPGHGLPRPTGKQHKKAEAVHKHNQRFAELNLILVFLFLYPGPGQDLLTSGILTPLDNFACRGLYPVYTGDRLTRGLYLVYLLARRS